MTSLLPPPGFRQAGAADGPLGPGRKYFYGIDTMSTEPESCGERWRRRAPGAAAWPG